MNKYKILCICFAVLDLLLFCCIGVLISDNVKAEEEPCDCAACEILSDVVHYSQQPPVGDDVLCYDYARGLVYSGFIREDGSVQLRINPEGNLVIVKTIETAESRVIRSEVDNHD